VTMSSKDPSDIPKPGSDTEKGIVPGSNRPESYQRTTEQLTIEEFIKREQALSDIALREKALKFLFKAFGGLLACTIVIIILQGFHLWNFTLEIEFLRWLGVATVGEVATLLTIAIGSLFKKK
jgi:hypothetical protein